LGSRYTVSFQTSRIEPLTYRAGGHFADLCDLSGCEDLHVRCSILSLFLLIVCSRKIRFQLQTSTPLQVTLKPFLRSLPKTVGSNGFVTNIWVGALILTLLAVVQFHLIRGLANDSIDTPDEPESIGFPIRSAGFVTRSLRSTGKVTTKRENEREILTALIGPSDAHK